MTRLLIFLIIAIKIFSEDKLNIYLSFNSKHVLVKNHDYTLNEDNNGISFEIQKVLFSGILINRKNSVKKVYLKVLEVSE